MRNLCAWKARVASIARSERGQALVEYALVLALVSVVAIGALNLLGTSVQSLFGQTNSTLETVLKTHGHCGDKACKYRGPSGWPRRVLPRRRNAQRIRVRRSGRANSSSKIAF